MLHTLNPRLAPEHVAYIANHAEDKAIFVDLNLLPIVEGVWPHLKTVKHVVVMTDRAHMPASSKIPNLLCYEELIADKPGTLKWPDFDEKTASSLCYTSGTTGNPKGVLYSHRSTMIHSIMASNGAVIPMDPDTTCCRWCRCSTPMPGAWSMPRRCAAPSWCSPAPSSTAPASTSFWTRSRSP